MPNYQQNDILVTGIGITSPIGQGKADFSDSLFEGRGAFRVMERQGRQNNSAFIGAEIDELKLQEGLSRRLIKNLSFSAQLALATLHEAWHDANLNDVDPARIGLIIGGSNCQQREISLVQDAYREKLHFLRPTYGMSFMDTDMCGICTEQFSIQGLAHTVGGASASGHLAVIQGIRAVQEGLVDVCIAIGSMMDLSYWECHGFRGLGAMGSDRFQNEPDLACRPFDSHSDGFIFGESCGAIVIERAENSARNNIKPYGKLSGWAMNVDGNRNPAPSLKGEIRAINQCLQSANLSPESIDYINPHGSGSVVGDKTELQALQATHLDHAYINATKSITGHGLTSAGTVEVIATLLQMQSGKLHPTRNLENPIDNSFNWVAQESIMHKIQNAISLSFGFGGINTAICIAK